MILVIIMGIFANIKTWTIGTVISAILGLTVVKKWTLIVDSWMKIITKWSGTIAVAMQKTSTVLFSVRDTAQKIDDAIADDGSTDLNTLKEALDLGKKVKVELDDVIVIFKPKK